MGKYYVNTTLWINIIKRRIYLHYFWHTKLLLDTHI